MLSSFFKIFYSPALLTFSLCLYTLSIASPRKERFQISVLFRTQVSKKNRVSRGLQWYWITKMERIGNKKKCPLHMGSTVRFNLFEDFFVSIEMYFFHLIQIVRNEISYRSFSSEICSFRWRTEDGVIQEWIYIHPLLRLK